MRDMSLSTPTIAGSRPGGRPTFLTQESRQRTLPCTPRRQNRFAVLSVPCAAHSNWGFSDSASLHSQKRLRHPASPLRFRFGLLTQFPLRCSARQTGGTRFARKTKAFGMLALLGLLTACLPYPHKKIRAPTIDGQVFAAGLPLAGVNVYLHLALDHPERCEPSKLVVRTDTEGRFHFDRQSEQHWVAMAASTIDNWALCIESTPGMESANGFVPGWFNSTVQVRERSVHLRCDIDRAAIAASPIGMACTVADDTASGTATHHNETAQP